MTTKIFFTVILLFSCDRVKASHMSNAAAQAAMTARITGTGMNSGATSELAALAAQRLERLRIINAESNEERDTRLARESSVLVERRARVLWAQELVRQPSGPIAGRQRHVYSEFHAYLQKHNINIPYIGQVTSEPINNTINITLRDFIKNRSAFIRGHDDQGRLFVSVTYTVNLDSQPVPANPADQDKKIHIITYFLYYPLRDLGLWTRASNSWFHIFDEPETDFMELAKLIVHGELAHAIEGNLARVTKQAKLAMMDELLEQAELEAKINPS